MIAEIVENLEKGKYLLTNISDAKYADKSIPPYHSSIGAHVRHILDVFQCVFDGLENKSIDLTKRERNTQVESFTASGLNYFDSIINQLNKLSKEEFDATVCVIDDLGGGKITVNNTLAGILVQAQSHAIHHYASIGYMLHFLEVNLPIDCFGVNPTTPKMAVLKDK